MKRIFFCMLLISLLMLTGCGNYSDEEDYQDDEAQIYLTQTEDAEFEEETNDSSETETDEETLPSNSSFGEIAREHLEVIAGDIGHREPGSAEEAQTAQYIKGVFEEIGYEVTVTPFTAYDEEEGESITSANVMAIKEGLSEQVIVVGAHYDAAYEDGTKGADDNASGVAVMLEVAELVYTLETPYTIEFIAFGSEELNLNGSTYYVENLSSTELENMVGMFNLDSLIAGDILYVYGNTGSGSMRDWVLNDAETLGIELEGKTAEELNNEDGTPCDCADYDAFEEEEIPFAYFEATNWDLSPDAMTQVDTDFGVDGEIRHTEYDTIEYIDDTFPGRIDNHLNVFVTLLFDLLTQY